jgi:hypothetical protein
MDPSRGCAKHLHPADFGCPDMGQFRYPQPCALPPGPWKLLSVGSFDGAAVSGHVSGACRVSALSTFTRPGSTLVPVCLFMCTLVLNSRESPSRSHRRCCVKARGRAPVGFAQEAGDIETASWLEAGALRRHIAILEAGPSCEKFLPCAESSCGRVDNFRGQGLCEYEAHTSKSLGRQPKDPEAQSIGPTTQGQCFPYANLATMPDEKPKSKAATEQTYRAIAMLSADQQMITIPSNLAQASLLDQYHF